MAYATLPQLKEYLAGSVGIDASHDALLTRLLDAATALIEAHTARVFQADTNTMRVFTGVDALGNVLYLDHDLCQLDSLTVDGQNVTLGEIVTEPRNTKPWYALIWKTSGWHGEIVISGRWAYSVTPPPDIVQLTVRMAAYLYQQKDAQVFDVTADVGLGQLTIPKGMPADVKQGLAPYRRLV